MTEIVLTTDDKRKLAAILLLAEKLNLSVEQRETPKKPPREELIRRILSFKAKDPAVSFGDAVSWQRNQREDRDLPLIR